MKSKVKILLIIVVALFLLLNLGKLIIGRNSSEMVQYGVMENGFRAELHIFKDEVIVKDTHSGLLRPVVADGERVHKGARIGAILSGNTDEAALHEHLYLQDRIRRLQTIKADGGYSETVRTDERISTLSLQILTAAERGDMAAITVLKDELMVAKDEKAAASGEKQALIDSLTQRQNALASKIGSSVEEVFSPRAGTLFLHTDGLEESMSTEKTDGLTPAALKELTEKPVHTEGGCKILYSNEWKGAAIVPAEKAAELTVGQVVSLRIDAFDGATEKATVHQISEEENGECVVIFSSNRTPKGLMQSRRVGVEVILARYEGLRVPKKALTENDGEKGVYVQTITEQVFRKTDVAYENETHAIVREGKDTTLKLYDTVVY